VSDTAYIKNIDLSGNLIASLINTTDLRVYNDVTIDNDLYVTNYAYLNGIWQTTGTENKLDNLTINNDLIVSGTTHLTNIDLSGNIIASNINVSNNITTLYQTITNGSLTLNNSYLYLLTTPIIQSSKGLTQNYFANDTTFAGTVVCSGSSTTIYNSSFALYNSLIKQLYDISLTALTNDLIAKTTFSNGIKLLNTSSIELNDGTLITQANLKDISANKINIATNTANIATHTANIATNTANITVNTGDINLLSYNTGSIVKLATGSDTYILCQEPLQFVKVLSNYNTGWVSINSNYTWSIVHNLNIYLPFRYSLFFCKDPTQINFGSTYPHFGNLGPIPLPNDSASYVSDITYQTKVGYQNFGHSLQIVDGNNFRIRFAGYVCETLNSAGDNFQIHTSGFVRLYIFR
jgi:hypothetical protein